MWRYSKELKRRSDDPLIGHEHVPERASILQSVQIRTNAYGLRGPEVVPLSPGEKRILFLGSSITLGWGVPEEKTMTARLERMFRDAEHPAEVLNAGVGNYNAVRYVNLFLKRLTVLKPDVIVVHYFLRDAEDLKPAVENVVMEHSELAVMMWLATSRVLNRISDQSLEDFYRQVYREDSPGYRAMLDALTQLAGYATEHKIRLVLAMVPDVHDLANYRFGFIHDRMATVAAKLGYEYVDLLPAFSKLAPPDIWAMPGDPHPNALGHELMAKALFPALDR
jgi:lysophospholipase L1-like esterase